MIHANNKCLIACGVSNQTARTHLRNANQASVSVVSFRPPNLPHLISTMGLRTHQAKTTKLQSNTILLLADCYHPSVSKTTGPVGLWRVCAHIYIYTYIYIYRYISIYVYKHIHTCIRISSMHYMCLQILCRCTQMLYTQMLIFICIYDIPLILLTLIWLMMIMVLIALSITLMITILITIIIIIVIISSITIVIWIVPVASGGDYHLLLLFSILKRCFVFVGFV